MKSKISKSTIIISFFAVITAALLFLCFAGCSQNSQQNNSNNDPIVGQGESTGKSKTQLDAKEAPVIFSVSADGEGYWMTLGDVPGFAITLIISETWEKEGSTTYSFTNTNGKNYKFEYNKNDDTIISENDGKLYSRLDPIVGIGTGVSSSQSGRGNASTIFKSDGTGLATITHENGTADITTLTGNKNPENKYETSYSDGIKRTYTVAEDGKSLTTDDGRSKTKCMLVSIVGAWYCPDKNFSAIFNADGTGFGNTNGQNGYGFTGKITDNGVDVTYTNGVDKDGNDVTGKTYTGKYNREDNTFSSSSGSKYIRPTSSIPGLITFK